MEEGFISVPVRYKQVCLYVCVCVCLIQSVKIQDENKGCVLGVEGMYRVKEVVPFPPVACQLLPVEMSAVFEKRV